MEGTFEEVGGLVYMSILLQGPWAPSRDVRSAKSKLKDSCSCTFGPHVPAASCQHPKLDNPRP